MLSDTETKMSKISKYRSKQIRTTSTMYSISISSMTLTESGATCLSSPKLYISFGTVKEASVGALGDKTYRRKVF